MKTPARCFLACATKRRRAFDDPPGCKRPCTFVRAGRADPKSLGVRCAGGAIHERERLGGAGNHLCICLKARSGAITLSEAEAARDNLFQWRRDFAITLGLESSDLEAATKLLSAFRLNLRAPDALHLAMAQRLNATLATFDAKLAVAGRAAGVAVLP